jgi:lysylphosphatidylglycerol synthetase-like protein (DUF2156 family)
MTARAQPLAPHRTTTPAVAAVAPPVPVTSLQTRATRVAYALVVLVTGVTAASRAGVVAPDTLAASPRRLAEGKVWLLATNGMLVQRPILLSLLSFALLSLFTLYLCGSRVFATSAAVGHVGSTLLAYLVVAVGFAVDRGSVRSVLDVPDYGVSAMQAAWIGAIAATVWRREGQTARGRVLTVGSCLAVTTFAWMLRSDLTLLDLDHLFAFTIGASFAAAWASPATPPLPRTARAFARRLATAATNLRTAPTAPWLPLVAASLVALIALANLQSAASPNIRWRGRLVKHLLPHGLPSISHALALPLSAALLLAAVSLARRRYRAWQSALGFLVALGVLDLLKGLSYEQAGMSLVAAVFLYWARPAFVVAPDPRALRSSLNLAAAVLAGTVALAAAATWVSIPGAPSLSLVLRESRALLLWQDGPVRFRHELRYFPLAVNLLSLGGALCAAWALFRPLYAPLLRPTHTSRRRARLLIRAYGRDTLAFFKLRQDTQYLFSPDRQAFLGYRIERNVLLVSGDPVGNPDSIPALLTETCRFAARHGLRLGVLAASEALLPIYRRAGLRAFYLGDEAILDTRSFSLAGRAIRKVRQSVNRLDRLGYQAELVLARDLDATDLAELRHVAAAHLGGSPERGFSMAMDTLRSDDTPPRRRSRSPATAADGSPASSTTSPATAAPPSHSPPCAAAPNNPTASPNTSSAARSLSFANKESKRSRSTSPCSAATFASQPTRRSAYLPAVCAGSAAGSRSRASTASTPSSSPAGNPATSSTKAPSACFQPRSPHSGSKARSPKYHGRDDNEPPTRKLRRCSAERRRPTRSRCRATAEPAGVNAYNTVNGIRDVGNLVFRPLPAVKTRLFQ